MSIRTVIQHNGQLVEGEVSGAAATQVGPFGVQSKYFVTFVADNRKLPPMPIAAFDIWVKDKDAAVDSVRLLKELFEGMFGRVMTA